MDVIDQLITYLYTSSYDPHPHHTALDVSVYAAADKYDIPSLASAVLQSFDSRLGSKLARFVHHLEMGRNPNKAKEFFNWFLNLIPSIYDSTLQSNRGLRDVIVKYAARYDARLRYVFSKAFLPFFYLLTQSIMLRERSVKTYIL